MSTGKELLQEAIERLGSVKRLEAEMLLASVLGYDRAHLLAHDREELTNEQSGLFHQLLQRRVDDEPLQYILGETNFMGMTFLVNPHVLIPRFDTEILVEQSLQLLQHMPLPKRIADICTGSGAIAISLAKYGEALEVWASDLSFQALAVAQENNKRMETAVRFRQGNLFEPFAAEGLTRYFSLITSNPPYVTSQEMATLAPEVLKEPKMALWGGDDGLFFYRQLIPQAKQFLQTGGALAVEIGYQQGEAVKELFLREMYQQVTIVKDWQGCDRVVFGYWNE